MEGKIGVIDLGSNTFHLLVAEVLSNGSFKTIHREREFIGLAENGMETLSQEAMERGLVALQKFKQRLNDFKVSKLKIIGTAALRTASNRNKFLGRITDELDFHAEIIEGKREAELIFKGVSLLLKGGGNHLIMDIGGGSVEFILIENGTNIWSKSCNIGVGVLHNDFHHSEPISSEEMKALNNFLSSELEELKQIKSLHKIQSIIGASGSFEVVETMNGKEIASHTITEVSLQEFQNISSTLIAASLEERRQMEGLPLSRVKMIVVAMLLIEKVIEIIQPNSIQICPYALKEGVLSELMH